MPIFEYDCNACGHRFEKLVPRHDSDVNCPKCESANAAKRFSVFAASTKNGAPAAPA